MLTIAGEERTGSQPITDLGDIFCDLSCDCINKKIQAAFKHAHHGILDTELEVNLRCLLSNEDTLGLKR